MAEIHYISTLNKKQGAKKRQLLNSPKNHIKPSYMKSTSKVSKLSFTEINSNKSLESLSGEIWEDMIGFEDCYQISNKGRIKSLEREVEHPRHNGIGSQTSKIKERIISLRKNNSGYMIYTVSLNSIKSHGTVHRRVAEVFIENENNKPCVNHKDGDKENNIVDNLEWVTYKENTAHAIGSGSINHKGVNNSSANFNREQVLEIRLRIKNGEKSKDLAKEFNVSTTIMSYLKNNKTHKDVI